MADDFEVSLGSHLMSGAVHHARPIWKWLGNVETWMMRNQLGAIQITKPIYVSGLARSGTSILIEILASHPQVATHQYRDFPFLFIPYWWRQTLERSAPPEIPASERAHGDRLMVTPNSPEAMEEVLWMAYFHPGHYPHISSVLDTSSSNPKFERFYREHIRKLLLITHKSRYAAKGNYNLTRLEYLLKLFPDARFVLPVRQPKDHIASLMKQHKLFIAAAEKYPRSIKHLDRVGHFEFGAHRRCINADFKPGVAESIEKLWRDGDEVRGWARYWASLYEWVADRLEANPALRQATLVQRYEDLCDQPHKTLGKILAHCELIDENDALINRWAPTIARPTYYKAQFTPQEENAISDETRDIAVRLGYSPIISY